MQIFIIFFVIHILLNFLKAPIIIYSIGKNEYNVGKCRLIPVERKTNLKKIFQKHYHRKNC